MTDNVEASENEGQIEGNNQADPVEVEIVDDDPMIIAFKEAEAELAAEGQGGEPKPAENPDSAPVNQPAGQPAGDKDQQPIMIPKPRLDQALAERDKFKEQAAYFQGVAETQKQMLSNPQKGEAEPGQTAAATDANAPTDAVAKAEADKLAAAERYENGEISLVEFKKIEIEKDREIRAEMVKQNEALTDKARQVANETVNARTTEQVLVSKAVEIQAQHPYVAEIDQLPEADKNFVWQQITNEAVFNLQKKGVNALDGSPASRLALMQEKAALTDKYGPAYTGKQLASQTQQGPKPLSETAQARAAKLDLAQNQPPAFTANGGDKADLTEADIENMSMDQLADALTSAPNLVNKAAGIRNR